MNNHSTQERSSQMNPVQFLSAAANTASLKTALIMLFIIFAVMLIITVVFTGICLQFKPQRGSRRKKNQTRTIILVASYTATALCLVLCLVCLNQYNKLTAAPQQNPTVQGTEATPGTNTPNPTDSNGETIPPTIPVPTDPTEPKPTLNVEKTADSDPAKWGINWQIIRNEQIVGSYQRDENISFDDPNDVGYLPMPGIGGFRGDNYRTGSAYGTVNVTNNTLTEAWKKNISSLARPSGGSWTGSGWTGQPLIVQWDAQTRQHMNLYADKKAKDGLVEVIYATLDGHIYFYDLDDGSYTRDPLNMGMAFKGAGALDPRGYPILYVGSGDQTVNGKNPRMYIISLIDCSIMYERGHTEPLTLRSWKAFDSSPLVDAETDTLIWPGETGILYTIKLNSNYDKVNGKVTINPETPVMARYSSTTGGTLGFEASAVVVDGYIFLVDNGGLMFCVDLNTMQLKWAQFVHDDTNATPVFQWENGKGYLYTACSTELTGDKCYITKIDASNGTIVWDKMYSGVKYDKNVSGGALGSPILGREGTELEGLIIYPIAKTPGAYNGILVALNTQTGEEVWRVAMNHYAWSSPSAIYGEDGSAHIILCDSGGYVHLMDSKGKDLATIGVAANVEATPAIFGNRLVVGTRGQRVYCIEIG